MIKGSEKMSNDDIMRFINAYIAVLGYAQNMNDIKLFHSYLCEEFTKLYEQEDSHELLLHIFEVLDGSFNERHDSSLNTSEISTLSLSRDSSTRNEQREDSLIDEIQLFDEESKAKSPHIEPILNESLSTKLPQNPFRGVYKSVMKCHS